MNESVGLNPPTNDSEYKKPICLRNYFHSFFKNKEKEIKFKDDSPTISCDLCNAPRWRHIVFLPVTEDESKDPHYRRYCKSTQKYLKEESPNAYKTNDGLCTLCLSKGICCYFADHPTGEDLSGLMAQLSLENENKVIFKFNEENSSLEFSINSEKFKLAKFKDLKKIYIRTCYKEIYDCIQQDNQMKALVTGIPGIGKSVFFFYYLYRYMSDEEMKKKPFAYAITQNFYYVFTYVSDFNYSMLIYQMKPDQRDYGVIIYDFTVLQDPDDPIIADKKIILSSPNPKRYKEFVKDECSIFYMPEWSFEELSLVSERLNENWQCYYEFIGGSLRILQYNIILISEKLSSICQDSRGDKIFKYFIATQEYQVIDDAISYLFIHINPTYENGKFNYQKKSYSFATPIIKIMLRLKYYNKISNINAMLLNSDELAEYKKRPTVTREFELATHKILTSNDTEINVLCMYNKDNQSNLKFKIKSPIVEMPVGKIFLYDERYNYIVPKSRNFTSVDSFYLDESNNTLYFFQITTAPTHPVKVTGLQYVASLYDSYDIKVDKFILIFVVNYSSKMNLRKQTIISQTKRKAKDKNVTIKKICRKSIKDDPSGLIEPEEDNPSGLAEPVQPDTSVLAPFNFLEIPQYLLRISVDPCENSPIESLLK